MATVHINTLRSLRDFKNDWKSIQELRKRSVRVTDEAETVEENRAESVTLNPFDCRDLAVGYVHDQADKIAEEFVRRWRTLDHRKVVVDNNPTWYQRRVRLPENFRLDQEPDSNPAVDERVVNLDSPSDTLSYSSELWKLFNKVPSVEKLEQATGASNSFAEITSLSSEDESRCRKRLRLSQCHDAVPKHAGPFVATIRLEFWKNRPTDDSLPDSNRLVLEFSESHTLLDVHKTLVNMAATNKWGEDDTIDKGFFFIENTFYVSNEASSAQSVIEWLKSDKKRLVDLGLHDCCISTKVKSMAGASLADLRCRLGVRYCHQSSSSFESALFVTDFRMINSFFDFPIVHDIWLESGVNCESCFSQPATRSTATTSALGHRALCKACCRLLKVPDTDHRCYTVWEGG